MNQKGFATLEIILMIMVVAILATMAVPQFEKITAQANTSKVQSDLAAINTAVAVYQMEKSTTVTNLAIDDLAEYFENGSPQPPTGSIYVITATNGTTTTLTKMQGNTWIYAVTGGKATFGGYTADKFITKTS